MNADLKRILAGTNFTRDGELDFNQNERNKQALRKLEAYIGNKRLPIAVMSRDADYGLRPEKVEDVSYRDNEIVVWTLCPRHTPKNTKEQL